MKDKYGCSVERILCDVKMQNKNQTIRVDDDMSERQNEDPA